MNDSAENNAPSLRQKCFFWCCAAVSLVALLGSNSLFWAEPRIAEAAREITVTGRWHPLTINFVESPDLPVLEVWSVALIFKLGVSEFAARLPSALAAIALLIGTIRLTKQLFDRRTALLTGWLTLGSFGVLYMGRCCGSGVFSGAFAVWAVVLYLRGVGRKSFWLALGLCVMLALGVLNRGFGFLWLPGALLLPWMFVNRPRLELRVAAAAGVAAIGLYLAWLFTRGEPLTAFSKWLLQLLDLKTSWPALKHWCVIWWSRRANPMWMGLVDVPIIMLPWTLITLAAFIGALYRIRRIARDERCLCAGIILGFLVLAFPASSLRTDFLPLVPFLALETGVWALRGEGGRLSRWAVVATRGAIVAAASFGTVALVTIPFWLVMLNVTLPMLFWAACVFFGAAVLVIMMLDCYPTHPLPRLTGLPDPLGSTVLGGTLASICLISFLLPSLREMRREKPFLLAVKKDVAERRPKAIVNVGGVDSTALLLFYADIPGRIVTVSERCDDRDEQDFVGAAAKAEGGRIAVIAPWREREKTFLLRCAAASRRRIDVNNPDRREDTQSGYAAQTPRCVFYLESPAEEGSGGSRKSTNVQNKGM